VVRAIKTELQKGRSSFYYPYTEVRRIGLTGREVKVASVASVGTVCAVCGSTLWFD
jgi:hypothetical protein